MRASGSARSSRRSSTREPRSISSASHRARPPHSAPPPSTLPKHGVASWQRRPPRLGPHRARPTSHRRTHNMGSPRSNRRTPEAPLAHPPVNTRNPTRLRGRLNRYRPPLRSCRIRPLSALLVGPQRFGPQRRRTIGSSASRYASHHRQFCDGFEKHQGELPQPRSQGTVDTTSRAPLPFGTPPAGTPFTVRAAVGPVLNSQSEGSDPCSTRPLRLPQGLLRHSDFDPVRLT
jgi:hypothetical protein